MVTDRRSNLRAPVSLLGAVDTGSDEQPVVVLDLSATGARIQTGDPPDETKDYLLHFSVNQIGFDAPFHVVHWQGNDGVFHWGCSFLDLAPEQFASLRRAVDAATGQATAVHRLWSEVLEEAYLHSDEQIVVGYTPAGKEIRLTGSDCFEIGEEGTELFVGTVASLESA